MKKNLLMGVAIVIFLLSIAPTVLPGTEIQCQTDADCPRGMICLHQQGVCVVKETPYHG